MSGNDIGILKKGVLRHELLASISQSVIWSINVDKPVRAWLNNVESSLAP